MTPENDLERDNIRKATKNIHELLKHKLGDDNEIQNLWESFSDRERSIIGVLASTDEEIGPTEIAERLNEDVTKGAVGGPLTADRDRDYPLTYKGGGGYQLSIIGEYIWKNLGPDHKVKSEDSVENTVEDVTEDVSVEEGQLNEFTD